MDSKICYEYEFSYIDFIIPRPNIFNILCTSDVKTQLFIIALIRLYILYLLTQYFRTTSCIYELFIMLIIFTLISIFIITIKIPQDIELENKDIVKEIPLFDKQKLKVDDNITFENIVLPSQINNFINK